MEQLTISNLLAGDLPLRLGTTALQRDARRAFVVMISGGLVFLGVIVILLAET